MKKVEVFEVNFQGEFRFPEEVLLHVIPLLFFGYYRLQRSPNSDGVNLAYVWKSWVKHLSANPRLR